MPNARVMAGSTQLAQSTNALRDQWRTTEETWNDAVRRRFEDRFLAPLEPAVDSAVNGFQKIAEVIDRVRKDCSDRGETW